MLHAQTVLSHTNVPETARFGSADARVKHLIPPHNVAMKTITRIFLDGKCNRMESPAPHRQEARCIEAEC